MTRRLVGVVAGSTAAPPPGVDAAAWRAAMLEDVIDLVSSMQQVEPVLVRRVAEETGPSVVWPGTPVVTVPDRAEAADLLAAVASVGGEEVAVVSGDAPDLPPLLLGKLHSALTAAEAAVCPAQSGLVAIATRVPLPGWLAGAAVSLDDEDALMRLRAAAPRRALVVGAGWHRLRGAGDVARLDPGLEGWECTRALLGG